jgi:hypothetical protein
MSYTSYEDGRAGRPVDSDTDLREYNRGERDRTEAEAAGWNQGKKVEISGVGFTLLLVSPFLILVYPVLGLTLYVVAGAMFALVYFTPLTKEIGIFIGFIACVASFFPAVNFEVKASQFKLYRIARTLWRVVNFSGLPVLVAGIMSYRGSGQIDPAAAGGAFSGGLITALVVHFLFRRCDRMYFPVWAEVEKLQELEERGISQRRRPLKRVFNSLLWSVPVVIVLSVSVRAFVGGMAEGPLEVAEFYDQYAAVVYGLTFLIWLVLCIAGILPGTGQRIKGSVDQGALLEQRPQ